MLVTSVGKLRLEKPGMVASGIMDETGPSMVRMLKCGAGAVVTKSIGSEPNPGHPNPTFTELKCGYINAMGLPNPGIELFGAEMEIAAKSGNIIGSIYGASPEEFSRLAGKMEEYGAAAVELNLSCPHAAGYGMELGTDPAVVGSIVSAVKSSVSIPVWAKLTPNTHILKDLAIAVRDAGGDAVVAINTVKAMAISPQLGKPILSNKFGGLSGPAIRSIGVRAVFEIRAATDIPIVGVGGISDWKDAAQYIMAGACAFQVGSAIGTKGIDVFSAINTELERFMKDYGYGSISKMIGVAHE
ncbi:MAG: dihydroorotate dehydrogenase [Candidatus Methanoplasma sp.]|jgi:dihydroorotate dehydrogenase (NAD+) catalytic subunit|nr:dihydroorotate dehydrogenase [Candidatus Methanoplasma sp.]